MKFSTLIDSDYFLICQLDDILKKIKSIQSSEIGKFYKIEYFYDVSEKTRGLTVSHFTFKKMLKNVHRVDIEEHALDLIIRLNHKANFGYHQSKFLSLQPYEWRVTFFKNDISHISNFLKNII